MIRRKLSCFVIMPFLAELNYFFLYLKYHIETSHHLECVRGDAQVLTVSLLEKINNYIKSADVIIADCTGRNANVFYEMGIAHAHDKKIILITQDKVEDAPSDIRHFEFIKYDLNKHSEFLEKIDNALSNVFVYRYEKLYEYAHSILQQFKNDTKANVSLASKEIFVQRLASFESTRELPDDNDKVRVTEIVLPRIIADSSDAQLMSLITEWIFKSASSSI